MIDFLVQPWKHQLEAIHRASGLDEFGLFFEMGAGKTMTAINIWRDKCNQKQRFFRTLILCPPIVVKNWQDEFLKNSKVPQSKIVLLTGAGRERLKKFLKNAYDAQGVPKGCIFVTNYESLLMDELFQAMQAWQVEYLILDESHKCKDQKAERTKLASRLANGVRDNKTKDWKYFPVLYRNILSGSPVLNTPMDLFSQFVILDGGATFGSNFFAFRATYFVDRNAGMPKNKYFPNWVIREGALEEINKKIQGKSMRVEKKDCLDLPPLVKQTLKLGMTPEQAQAYATMKADFLAFIKDSKGQDHTAAATMALTKALRLQQITSGFVKSVEGKEISFGKTPKMAALEELLAELTPHSKVIVWSVWKENYAQIRAVCEKLGVHYVEVNGETPANKRFDLVEEFNSDPKCRVFSGHPGSGGIGINLVVAKYCIFYSRTFSLEHSIQAEARNYRGGSEQHDKVTRIDLVCENSIEELVQRRLDEKQEIGDTLLRNEIAKELSAQET